jgi:hypothetical protein
MANPTSQVPSTTTGYEDTKGYWPLKGGAFAAKTYQTGQMLGVRADGYASDMDDSAVIKFLGILHGHNVQVDAGDPDGKILVHYDRPHRIRMKLTGVETASRATNLGAPVYAVDGQSVSLNAAALTNDNIVGHLTDVINISDPAALTGTIVEFKPRDAFGGGP